MVGAKGFEPSTSWSRTRRASQAALRPESQRKLPSVYAGLRTSATSHFPPISRTAGKARAPRQSLHFKTAAPRWTPSGPLVLRREDRPDQCQPSLRARRRLEIQLQSELDQTRSARLADLTKCSAESAGTRIQKLCVVEGVEEFRAELDFLRLRDLRILQKRNVPVVDSRPPKRVPSQIAKRC